MSDGISHRGPIGRQLADKLIQSPLYTPAHAQGTTPSGPSIGVKHDGGKARLSILPGLAIEQVMKVGEFGSRKYGDHNYRNGMKVSRYLDAAFRHIFIEFLFKGIDNDQESGLPHLAHGAWNILAALEQMMVKPEFDNRVGKKEASDE